MDLILGVKNIFELEGIMNSRTCSFNFLNRSLPIFPLAHYKIKPGKMAYVKVRIPFVEKLSGIAIVKLLYKYHIGTMRVRIDHNQSIIKIINNTNETIYYSPQLSMGILFASGKFLLLWHVMSNYFHNLILCTYSALLQ